MVTLSTLGQSNLLIREFSKLQGDIQNIQTQVATTAKTQRYGDLGSQVALDISLRNQASEIADYKDTISQLQVRTGLMDASLGIVHDSALHVQNLGFQSPMFTTDRINLVSEAKAAIDQITQRLQTQVDGRNLFGGTQTQSQTMVPSGTLMPTVQTAVTTAITTAGAAIPPASASAAIQTAVAGIFATTTNFYSGGPAAPPTQIDRGLSVDISITGADPAFQTILQGLYTLAALPQPVGSTATPPNITDNDFDATASAAATLISQGLSKLETLTERNGNNEKLLADESTQHDATLTVLQTQINDIENVDMAAASTRLTQLKTQLEASYSITATLSNLSLVNFLK